jgi:carbon monoxide dehydrogenase subunit G
MEYTISAWEPSSRVVLDGVGSGVRATDDIRFTATPTGTRVDYTADIHLTGLMRLAEPFAGGAFDKIAKDAAAGMKKALDARAETAAR